MKQSLVDLMMNRDTDKAGRKVCPQSDNMNAPGDCNSGDQQRMQQEIDSICSMNRKCYPGMAKMEAQLRAEINRQCAVARNELNNECFKGGDVNHRNMAIDAFNSAAECYKQASRP